jgi:hypothetical protein
MMFKKVCSTALVVKLVIVVYTQNALVRRQVERLSWYRNANRELRNEGTCRMSIYASHTF